MPFNDWQFWVVTIIAIGALWMLKRVLMPKKKGTKATLTVGGKPITKHKPKSDDCGCE
ncbi:MAG: hypothetical protein JKY96_00220 [Phycisphaerales bacterium]|nr:hypothetical protein [Phycisphaerales bacterium]